MKRPISILCNSLVIAFVLGAGTASAASVVGTKHDFSPSGSSAYKVISGNPSDGGTTEICIFCHTPHSAKPDAPLWNHSMSVATYFTYTSDVLAGLGYPAAEDPKTGVSHAKTRICLSCHDGTIALGSVVNMPNDLAAFGYTQIQMSGDSAILPSSTGYIGANLRDDHPVAIKHDSVDPELAVPGVGGGVRLYKDLGGKAVIENAYGNYVECTSCHDVHDNTRGNFLSASNQNSALCNQCHAKTGYASGAHRTSSVAYQPPGQLVGSTVGDVQCMNCHFPHKAGVLDVDAQGNASPNISSTSKAGYYLLSFQEERACFGNKNRWGENVSVCHGTSSADINRNIQLVENSNAVAGRRHWTQDGGTALGKHEATEGKSAGWLGSGNTNWHVECADCHNPHTAGGTNHTAGSNAVTITTSPLYGAGGVSKTTQPRTWLGGPSSWSGNYIEPRGVIGAGSGVQFEYEICLKCHSDFAWGTGTAPTSPTLGSAMTDQAMEFIPNSGSVSYHPVVEVTGRSLGVLLSPWDVNIGTKTMYCSDCHTKDGGTSPVGPHGSSNMAILITSFDSTPGTLGGGALGAQSGSDLCFNCHSAGTYLTPSLADSSSTGFSTAGGNNLHARHADRALSAPTVTTPYSYKCVNCHVRVPHGYYRKGMITISTDAAPYNNGSKITAEPSLNTSSYIKNDCTTANGCHQ